MMPGIHSVGTSDVRDFRQIFERELAYVLATLRRLGVRPDDLRDVAQEVFVTVHRILDDYDPERPLRPWLFGIAYRIALRHRSLARHTREVLEPPAELSDLAPLADVQIERAEARALVHRALARVEIHRRAVFVLSDIDGLAVPEIAAVLGIPLNTAYSRLRRAREDFTKSIALLNRAEKQP